MIVPFGKRSGVISDGSNLETISGLKIDLKQSKNLIVFQGTVEIEGTVYVKGAPLAIPADPDILNAIISELQEIVEGKTPILRR